MPERVPRFDQCVARLDFLPDAKLAPGVAPARVDDATGFVLAEALLARDGHLVYGDGKETWNELRPREELVRAAKSFHAVAVTDLHPEGMVTTENWRTVARGFVFDEPYVTEPDENGTSYLAARLKITDADMIKTIREGQVELSIGFWARIVDAPEGSGARFAQVDMLGNHVASVPRGRAGAACRVFLDQAAFCAYDRPVTHDAQAVDMVDYPLPDGSIAQIPSAVSALIENLQSTVAQLNENAAQPPEEPDMSEAPEAPEAPEQPEAPEAPEDAEQPEAPEAPEDEPKKDEGARVTVDAALATSVIENRMPWMKGKLDGQDLQTLFAAAMAMPVPTGASEPAAPKGDAAPENPFAQPEPVKSKTDSADSDDPVLGFVKNLFSA
ncbi:MAG: DUF2213 domain-containing protein [Planctomycetota bacterium]|nr:DUF2213 domain-containing protein [Planctomycetota bacterium]